MLSQSGGLLEAANEPALAGRVTSFLMHAPLEKPDDHLGPAETDMFQLSLGARECRRILVVITDCAERRVTTPETENRGLGGFVEAWDEYLSHLIRDGG